MRLKTGDPITVRIRASYALVREQETSQATVTGVWRDTFESSDDAGTLATRDLSDEGVTWIRGHHAPDSPEAQAMLAAAALDFERPQVTPAGNLNDNLNWSLFRPK